MVLPYILFAVGLLLIIKGGDYFVDSATWIAKVTRMPEVLIGATIVSLATTFPETMVSTLSAIGGQPAMAIGNAVGSTICNTGLILGLYNFIRPSKINSRVFVVKGLLLISYIGVLWLLSLKGVIDLRSSFFLLSLLLLFIASNLAIASYRKNKNSQLMLPKSTVHKEWMPQIGKFVVGIVLIIIGSKLLVTYGIDIAELWGVPSAVISLSIIALGTSLPELVTSMTALMKGHAGLSMGNILGANILNICMVLGISAQFSPLEISKQNIYLDIPVSLGINLLLVVPSILTRRISRLQAALLLAVYGAYMVLLFYINAPI